MPFSLFEGALGGIGLFLLGMRLLSEGIRLVATDRFRSALLYLTSNRYFSLLFGSAMTLVVSSGSAAIIFTIGLLNGGVINAFQALCVLSGVLVGTSLSLHLHIIPYSLISGPLILSGVLLKFFSRERRRAHYGTLLLGVGLLFLGLSLLEGAYRQIDQHPLYNLGNEFFYKNGMLAVLFGTVVSFLVQSTHSTISIISSLLNDRAIDISHAIAMSYGALLGMVAMGLLASVGGKYMARRSALLMLLISIIVASPMLLFSRAGVSLTLAFAKILHGVDHISILAWGYSIPCILSAAVMFVAAGPFSRLMHTAELAADGRSGVELPCAGYLDSRILSTPPIAIEQARKEIMRMVGITSFMYADVRALLHDFDVRRVETIRQHEQTLDSLNHEITSFLASLSNIAVSPDITYEIPGQIQVVSALEHIGDVTEDILDCLLSKKESAIVFSDDAMGDLISMAEMTASILADAEQSIKSPTEPEVRNMLHKSKSMLRGRFDEIKQSHFERICSGVCPPRSAMLFQEMTASFMRIAELCWNIIGMQLRRAEQE